MKILLKSFADFYRDDGPMLAGAIYGSLTAIVTFLMWLFYSSSIFLVGAELVHNLGNSKK